MGIKLSVRQRRDLAQRGWADGGDNHWSKEGVGYIHWLHFSGMWEVQEWSPIRSRQYKRIEDAVERAEFDVRADKALDKMFAQLGLGAEA